MTGNGVHYTNQGRLIDPVFDAVTIPDLRKVAEVIGIEVSGHPPGSNCDCLAIEAIAVLQELGYRIERVSFPIT